MERQTIVQLSLWFLCASAAFTGLSAAVAPHAFYDDFPFVAHWVDLLPPYNEHLTTDVGELYLGFTVLFAWAAWSLQPTLVRAACFAWLLPAVLHLGFHATHLDRFGTADAIAELASLTFVMAPAIIALWAVGSGRGLRDLSPHTGDKLPSD
jgi:hypothetical protein